MLKDNTLANNIYHKVISIVLLNMNLTLLVLGVLLKAEEILTRDTYQGFDFGYDYIFNSSLCRDYFDKILILSEKMFRKHLNK